MEIKEEKFLPLGSIVKVKETQKRLMIIGYCNLINVDKKKENDYVACIYPEGIFDLKNVLAFKHNQIEELVHMGYVDDKSKALNEVLNYTELGKGKQGNE